MRLMRRMYPEVRVGERVLFVDDGDVLTSAGLAAGIDLRHHLRRGIGMSPSSYRKVYQGP